MLYIIKHTLPRESVEVDGVGICENLGESYLLISKKKCLSTAISIKKEIKSYNLIPYPKVLLCSSIFAVSSCMSVLTCKFSGCGSPQGQWPFPLIHLKRDQAL